MTDTMYHKFVKRWEEVTDLPPQTLGPLTPYYKTLVGRLKVMPWPMLVLGSSLVVISLYILLGSSITLLVSILQKGF
ncbi:MAG: hypothetical protein UY27_C0006G0007 [Candidatus Gottesmanbacteria bacterium GW2011_GWA1_48_13]|uniref:Uncharacterized protein n=1 Tax=Candidatus Gottesmanbacteria bacterium GW2011_GWA1_48_13 TaxID=1618439 RepID=A0A0G1UPA3_9BACT|nr:MAG: hypothetical protein UY27_C0006G0007 [Candidatus Gottesmanbacteria bacterium GW2011_GWA1_48_13]